MKITNDYVFFWSGFLSNFHPCKIEYGDNVFHCSEQLFMFLKAKYFNDNATAKLILAAKTPKEAKVLGRQVQNFNEEAWKLGRETCMTTAVMAKFSQNKDLKEKLLSPEYEDKTFVEASPFDTIWGIGMDENNPDVTDSSKWKGLNLLGIIITYVRKWILTFENGLDNEG